VARTVTLSQLRTDISTQADISTNASGRYTPTQLNRYINQSIQRFREKLSSEGVQHYLASTTGTLSTGATSPYPFLVLDLTAAPPNIVRVFGVDITQNSVVTTLSQIPFADRDNYGGPSNRGTPTAWSNMNTAKLAIFPPPSQALTYVVWYLPVLADLSADGDTFDGIAGWEDYIVWDVVVKLIVRDQYANAYALATQTRNEIWADILRNATKVTSAGGAVTGRDSMGRRGLWAMNRTRLLPPP
jgi:hypothetical protein